MESRPMRPVKFWKFVLCFFLLLGSDFCGEWLHNCGYYEYYYREMRYKMNKIGNSNKNSKIVVEKSFLFIRALQTTKMYV